MRLTYETPGKLPLKIAIRYPGTFIRWTRLWLLRWELELDDVLLSFVRKRMARREKKYGWEVK